MFEDDKDAVKNEKGEKPFKFIDKRKYSEDSVDSNDKEGKVEQKDVEVDVSSTEKDLNSDKSNLADKTEDNAPTADKVSDMSQFGADFSTFVYSLNTQVLLFLGKIPNPMTGKYEKDINMAKYLIDTIDMLSKKNQGKS